MAARKDADVLALVDCLAARGVTFFEGQGIKVIIGPAPSKGAPPTPGQPHVTALVDAGGGLMVDPDVLGHEGG